MAASAPAASPIQHVADTAFWVAAYRARESARPDALFRDPLAARLVEGKGEAIERAMAHTASAVAWSVAIRTVVLDELLLAAVADGCDVVLNLGAGLDTRPYRLALPPALEWVEVDFEPTLSFKAERLAGETPRCRLSRVPADLGDASARQRVLREAAARGRKVFVLTEGVVPYLSLDEAAALADDLRALPSVAAWVVERYTPFFLAFRERTGITRKLENAPFRFAPPDVDAFFAAHGWRIDSLRFQPAEARRLGRPRPEGGSAWDGLRGLLRLVLMPSAQRKAMAEMSGWAVLRPGPLAPSR